MNINAKRVLITGGSSGIGLALAIALGAKGARVAISGRRQPALEGAVALLREHGVEAAPLVADVATAEGRATTLDGAVKALGGIDVLINNAGGVRAGRLEETTELEIRSMIEVDLIAPILLVQAALPRLRESGDALIVNISSGIGLIGMPFYSTYAAAKAGIARFGEAMRRELVGEGVHVLNVYPGATETPMMQSSKVGPELGVHREPASAVADATVAAIEANAFEVIQGGDARAKMIALNRDDPAALDRHFAGLKQKLADAVRGHTSL